MQAVTKAEAFFARHGREIDRARFRFHFAGGTQEDVLAALGPMAASGMGWSPTSPHP
jgi:hypothetical protein